ncbi:MAG: hypothetical protein Q9200_000117 [Gallowayella weberi]
MEMLDGYEELPEDWQEKVKRAITNGHVDDEDWKGDLEQNRPGKRGFRSPAPKKKKKVEDEEVIIEFFALAFPCNNAHMQPLSYPLYSAQLQFSTLSTTLILGEILNFPGTHPFAYFQVVCHSGAQDGGESPSKAPPKKRGRAKKEDLEEDETEEPARKKPKAAAKKPAKVKDEEKDFDDSGKTIANKGEQPKGQAVEIDGTTKPKRKAAAKRTKAPKEEAIVDGSDTLATVPKETNDVGTRGKETIHGDGSKDSKTAAQPAKATRRRGKAPIKNPGQQDLAGELEEQAAKTTKSPRISKSAANTKKPITKRRQQDMETAEEPAVAAAPKAKRGRKKAAS